MSQINVNSGPPVDTGERSGAGFNMLAVVLALVVAVVVVWLLFAGLFGSGGSSTTNVTNVNPPAQSQPAQKDGPSVNINVPKVDVNTSGQQSAPQPAAKP